MKPGYTYMVNVSWLLTSQLEKGKGSITPWSVPIYGEWRNKEMWWMTVNIFRVPNSLESTTKARRDQCQLIYIRINDNIIWLNMAYGTSYIFQVQLMILNHGFFNNYSIFLLGYTKEIISEKNTSKAWVDQHSLKNWSVVENIFATRWGRICCQRFWGKCQLQIRGKIYLFPPCLFYSIIPMR